MNETQNNVEFSKFEKNYSEEKFWDKAKVLAKKGGVKIIYTALKLFYAAKAPDTPTWAKAVIYGALGYLILPIDAIPDVIPGIGFTDDIAVLAAAVAVVAAHITDDVRRQARAKVTEWFGEQDIEKIEDNDTVEVEEEAND